MSILLRALVSSSLNLVFTSDTGLNAASKSTISDTITLVNPYLVEHRLLERRLNDNTP